MDIGHSSTAPTAHDSDEERYLLRLIGTTLRRMINGEQIERISTERRDEVGILANMVNRVGKELELTRKRDQLNLIQLEQRIAELQSARETQNELRSTISEISTPILNIFAGISLVPLVGLIDHDRAQLLITKLLQHVAQQQARIVILDVTAVAVLDTHVAQVLVQAAQSCRLLGANVILCGITPEVAQVVVSLGVDMRIFTTSNDLQAALNTALQFSRHHIVPM